MLNSFGSIVSQTGATVDYDQFFSGLAWDADSQLYDARARWYDQTINAVKDFRQRFPGFGAT